MRALLRNLTILCFTALLLTGCGFHLRGQTEVAPELRLLYLETATPYSAFTVQLRRNLQSLGIIVTDCKNDAPLTMHILNDSFGEQLTSISANTQVRTYILTYTICFQIENAACKVIIPSQTVTSTNSYQTSVIQTLGDKDVLNMVQDEMRRDAINQIINRLNAQRNRCILSQACL